VTIAKTRLPSATTDVEQLCRDLDEFGYGLLSDALTPDQVTRARDRVIEQAECESRAGIAYGGDGRTKTVPIGPIDETTPRQAVRALVNKGSIFWELIQQPAVLSVVEHAIGPEYILTSTNAIMLRGGAKPQALHSDLNAWLPFPVAKCLFVNVMYMITDFDAARGATHVVPGTHTGPAPDYTYVTDEAGNIVDVDLPGVVSVVAEGPAGTAIIFDARVWHGGGANTSGELRIGLQLAYTYPTLRQQDAMTNGINDDVYAAMTDEQRRLCGFATFRGGIGRMDPGTGRVNVDIQFPQVGELHR
jgi:ectoine hydroxylase-related dioxygenase (phytanoyl-CoA dioxygenase family)